MKRNFQGSVEPTHVPALIMLGVICVILFFCGGDQVIAHLVENIQ